MATIKTVLDLDIAPFKSNAEAAHLLAYPKVRDPEPSVTRRAA